MAGDAIIRRRAAILDEPRPAASSGTGLLRRGPKVLTHLTSATWVMGANGTTVLVPLDVPRP